MVKICIATAYDAGFGYIGNYAASCLQFYADSHGFDTRVVSSVPTTDWHPAWFRLQLIEELFDEGYDFVFWVDADALIVRRDVNIAEEIEDGKDLYCVLHGGGVEQHGTNLFPNTGVMLLRNSQWVRELFDEMRSHEEYALQPLWDQSALCLALGYHEAVGGQVNMVDHSKHERIKFLHVGWNHMPFNVAGTNFAEEPIICHFSGLDQDKRSDFARRTWLTVHESACSDTAPAQMDIKLASLEAKLKQTENQRDRFKYLLGKATHSVMLKKVYKLRRLFDPNFERFY
ncbi:MAG: putative nucleotide-diphospho-sugar transferase [Pseudomonadota bacterium]